MGGKGAWLNEPTAHSPLLKPPPLSIIAPEATYGPREDTPRRGSSNRLEKHSSYLPHMLIHLPGAGLPSIAVKVIMSVGFPYTAISNSKALYYCSFALLFKLRVCTHMTSSLHSQPYASSLRLISQKCYYFIQVTLLLVLLINQSTTRSY